MPRLNPRTERVIVEQVDDFLLKKERPSFAALLRRIREACLAESLSAPARRTAQRRVSELIPISAACKRGNERSIEAASKPNPGQLSVATDQTPFGRSTTQSSIVIVVDEQYRQPVGRPVLTIAIDVCTRMVAISICHWKPRREHQLAFASCTRFTTRWLGWMRGALITTRLFGILNELAIEAIQDGTERVTDENIES